MAQTRSKATAAFTLFLGPWSFKWALYWLRGWGYGPETVLEIETQWFLQTCRLRWRIGNKRRLFYGHRFWWREELERHREDYGLGVHPIGTVTEVTEVAHG